MLAMFDLMSEACSVIWSALVLLFRSRASLAAEILVLRHQINILRRHSPKRQTFSAMDRLIFAWLYRLAPTVLRSARDSAQGFRQLALNDGGSIILIGSVASIKGTSAFG